MNILGATWVPGLPHLTLENQSPHWDRMREGYCTLQTHLNDLKPEILIVYSASWMSVLGTSFQAHPNPKGTHVDENWHEMGELSFDFPGEPALANQFASALKHSGFPSKTIHFEGFPIDTASIVAQRFLNADKSKRVSTVSSWVYGDANKTTAIGQEMRSVLDKIPESVFILAISALSYNFFPTEIDPKEDHIREEVEDKWNKTLLGEFESGGWLKDGSCARQFQKNVPVEMQLNALHWLKGILGKENWKGQVHSYGPIWGTGNAVVEFRK